MDYALTHALSYNMDKVTRVLSLYDINCQYITNIHKRLAGNPFISLPEAVDIVPGIGVWHVHGHQPECLARYAPNFICGAGQVDGEIMETLWSSLNVISPSARGMSFPH
jgi:Kyakuja-Dileera-Zisupton transposase